MSADAATLVVVPTMSPLAEYHAQDGGRTRCGLLTHGWYPLTVTVARSNACTPCRACFPPTIDRRR